MLIGFIRDCLKQYNELKLMEKKKKRLLKKEIDYEYLEYIISRCNENDKLKVKIKLPDGTELDIRTTPYKEPNKLNQFEYINDDTMEVS